MLSCRCIPRPHTLNSPKDAPERSEPLLPQRIRHQGLVAATREVAPQSTNVVSISCIPKQTPGCACLGRVLDSLWMERFPPAVTDVTVRLFENVRTKSRLLGKYPRTWHCEVLPRNCWFSSKKSTWGWDNTNLGQELARKLHIDSQTTATCGSHAGLAILNRSKLQLAFGCDFANSYITTCGVKLPYQSSERSHERRDLLHNLTGIKTIQTHSSTAMAPFLPCSLYRASLWCLEPLWACQHEGSNVRCTKVNHAKRMEKKGKGFTMLQASSSYISLSLTVVLTFSKAVWLHIFSSAGNVVTPTGLDTQLPSWNTQICLSYPNPKWLKELLDCSEPCSACKSQRESAQDLPQVISAAHHRKHQETHAHTHDSSWAWPRGLEWSIWSNACRLQTAAWRNVGQKSQSAQNQLFEQFNLSQIALAKLKIITLYNIIYI